MPRIQFPNVPNDAGVPQLLRRLPAAPPTIIATPAGLGSLARALLSDTKWGVFKVIEQSSAPTAAEDGTPLLGAVTVVAKRIPALTPDSFLDFEVNQEWSVSTAPTQRGAFADYNRVASPFEIKLRMAKGGSALLNPSATGLKSLFVDPVQQRRDFLQQIEDLSTTQLYDIVTPERTYPNCNFIRSEISRRGEKGAYWLNMVDVYFREIRVVTATYSKTVIAKPTTASAVQQVNAGTQGGITSSAKPPISVKR